MKRTLIVGGSLFAIIILVLASLPVTAITQKTIPQEKSMESNFFIYLKNLLNDKKSLLSPDWEPGDIIDILINILIGLLYFWGRIFPPQPYPF